MNEILPITIKLEKSLNENLPKLKAITNRLEAQFNFQTLTAGWYGDEEDVLAIQLLLESPLSYTAAISQQQDLSIQGIVIEEFSDDAISFFNQIEQQVLCYVAITEKEIQLLNEEPKILVTFIEKKLHKVLNLIAVAHDLSRV
jgi:hypothetical protein